MLHLVQHAFRAGKIMTDLKIAQTDPRQPFSFFQCRYEVELTCNIPNLYLQVLSGLNIRDDLLPSMG